MNILRSGSTAHQRLSLCFCDERPFSRLGIVKRRFDLGDRNAFFALRSIIFIPVERQSHAIQMYSTRRSLTRDRLSVGDSASFDLHGFEIQLNVADELDDRNHQQNERQHEYDRDTGMITEVQEGAGE